MRQSQLFSIDRDPSKLRSGCPYAEHHELVRSVVRCREDSCDIVVSVANVSEDIGEHNFVTTIVWDPAFKPCTEGDVYKQIFDI